MKTCDWCGGSNPPTRRPHALFCSYKCYHRANSKKYRDKHRLKIRRAERRRYYLRIYGHDLFVDQPVKNQYDKFRRARAYGYRSGLEVAISEQLKKLGVAFEYEAFAIPFNQPAKPRRYSPDYALPNGIIVETKGRFVTSDRQKHLMVKEQHPDLEIRFVFSNPDQRISKQSRTTYALWCEAKGFKYAKGSIPVAWVSEPANQASLDAITKLRSKP